jgi:hypothetical protein
LKLQLKTVFLTRDPKSPDPYVANTIAYYNAV